MADEGFLIGPNLRAKLRETFRKSDDALVGKEAGLLLETRYTDAPGYAPKAFRICTFTGAWSKADNKTVTFKYQTSTPNTAQALNLFFPLTSTAAGSHTCAIAKEGTAWYLTSVEVYTATSIIGISAVLNTTNCGIVVTTTTAAALRLIP